MLCHQVDKHIRKLDADLARFEADIKDKNPALRDAADPVGKKSMPFMMYFAVFVMQCVCVGVFVCVCVCVCAHTLTCLNYQL